MWCNTTWIGWIFLTGPSRQATISKLPFGCVVWRTRGAAICCETQGAGMPFPVWHPESSTLGSIREVGSCSRIEGPRFRDVFRVVGIRLRSGQEGGVFREIDGSGFWRSNIEVGPRCHVYVRSSDIYIVHRNRETSHKSIRRIQRVYVQDWSVNLLDPNIPD